MKSVKKYILIIILFILSMVLVLFYFMNRYSNVSLLNKGRRFLGYLYSLNEGNYIYKPGALYTENGVLVTTNYIFDGEGKVNVDKYGNVRFFVNDSDVCVNKTALGNVNITEGKCKEFETINASISKNNRVISFNLSKPNLEYMISQNDKLDGKWFKGEYDDNLIIKFYKEGTNYIWFKDSYGNLSEVLSFEVNCFNGLKSEYNEDVLYCSGSSIIIDGTEWIVLYDKGDKITLLKYLPLDVKESHCLDIDNNFCYYDENNKIEYNWENSYINYYLNNIYVNELPYSIREKLVDTEICINFDKVGCDGDGCGGYTNDIISSNNWYCDRYTTNKIRLISYYDYNYVYENISNKELLKGNYWAIDSVIDGRGSSIQFNYDFYVNEDFKNKLDLKPVITILKY